MLFLLLACRGAAAPRDAAPLVDPELWAEAAADEDPFGDRPDAVSCDEGGWYVEELGPDLSLAVDTIGCDYFTGSQPALVSLLAGDTLSGRLWHYDLDAMDGGEAHAAVMIGGELVWEEYVPIPSESGMLLPEVVVERDFEAGEEVWFHLHNHGSNSYNLIDLIATPPEE
jgi:hypothetical protein